MKFNDIDPRTLHRGISIAKEIPPGTVTSQLETLSGSTGEIVVGRTIKQAEYIVRVNIAGKYRDEAWKIRKLLAAWARGTDSKTYELIPTHWPEVHYDAILKEVSPPEFTFGFGVIDVVFTIPRPIAVENMVQSSFSEGNGINKLTIGGSSYARPTITAFCKGSTGMNFSVGIKKYLGLTGSFAINEKVEISANPPRVRLKSGSDDWVDISDRIDYTTSDFQGLAEAFTPGEHTVICPQSNQLNIEWKDEWL